MSIILFYLFSVCIVVSAFLVIFSKNSVHSVLYLILSFMNACGILLLLETDFLAIIFIVVYVGAIAILFLFVVMMLDLKSDSTGFNFSRFSLFYYVPVGFIMSLIFFIESYMIIFNFFPSESSFPNNNYINYSYFYDGFGSSGSTIEYFGNIIYTYYFYPFILSGFILLIAMIGAVVLTVNFKVNMKGSSSLLKRQYVFEQISRDSKKALFKIK